MDGAASTLAGRDTFVGLTGGFGSVLYGANMDSPYKRGVQGKDPFYATGIATQKAILGSPGFNVVSGSAVAAAGVAKHARRRSRPSLMSSGGMCPSSTMTLKMGVERSLKEELPEIKRVISV